MSTKPPAKRSGVLRSFSHAPGDWKLYDLAAGPRPFLVVNSDPVTTSGWLFLDPDLDGPDPVLREAGLTAQQRQQPCYLHVPTALLR